MRAKLLLGVSLLGLLLTACSFKKSDHPAACRANADCDSNQCVQGFCIEAKQDGGTHAGSDHDAGRTRTDTGSGADAGGGQTGEACEDGTPPMNCYDGPDGTADVGICRGGQRACISGQYTQCLGQVLPGDETCNGKDDNCDGQVDEIPMGGCSTQMEGICGEGALTCRGTFAVCAPVNQPTNEVCNQKDDDCDGNIDEMMSAACYPKNKEGCTAGPGGTFMCTGLCQPGQIACGTGGDRCMHAVPPAVEACTKNGDTAADEDCDGKIDEGCACASGAMRSCYGGLAGTEKEGTCKAGTQHCVAKTWGDCEGQVTPEPETCDNPNEDNDCDGMIDNIAGLGDSCIVPDTHGICLDGTQKCTASGAAPVCVGPAPMTELCDEIDQDCDGNVANGFDLNNDPQNCGKCGNSCGRDEACCEGQCRRFDTFQTDSMNCGKCGAACDPGAFCCQAKCTQTVASSGGGHGTVGTIDPGNLCQCDKPCADTENCCGQSCVDLSSDVKNCGACGNVCSTVLNLGLLGQCAKGHCQ